MPTTPRKRNAAQIQPSGGNSDDPVLADLRQAADDYLAARAQQQHTEAEITRLQAEHQQARAEITQLQDTRRQLTQELKASRQALEAARDTARRYQERANYLASSLKEINQAIFSGSIYSLILKACITITSGTRGLYITQGGGSGTLRVQAASNMESYPRAPLSPFIRALCQKALQTTKTLVYNNNQDLGGLPQPARTNEQFRNCLAAPVMLLHHLDGIVLVFDKVHGDFEEDDVEALLSVGDQAAIAIENRRLQLDLQQAYVNTVSLLADTIEAKDPYTQGHCAQVARYARFTAEQLGLPEEEVSIAYYAGLLHDVGKIAISDSVLNKPGALLPEERELMRAHVRVGRDLLARVPVLDAVSKAVLHHHEFFDGHGYPDGLGAEHIPIAARIVGVVDAYCAMTTKRSYKEMYSQEYAREELQRGAGTQFDPQVLAAFLAVLDSGRADTEDECDEDLLLPGFSYLRDLH